MAKCTCRCQQRFVIAFMCLSGVLVAFAQRICISIAITRMVSEETRMPTDECPLPSNSSTTKMGLTRDWDQGVQQGILMSFYAGYLTMHLPAGILCDRFSPRKIYMIGMVVSTLFTFLTPPALYIPTDYDWVILMFVRCFVGMGQAVVFPALSVLMTRWVPPQERGSLGAFTMASSALGIAFGNYISGQLTLITKDWQMAFYFWGFIGILWVYGANSILYNNTDTHPYISAEEKEYLEQHIIQPQKFKTPWRAIVEDRAIIALISGSCGTDLWVYLNLTNIPKYFDNVIHIDMNTISIATSAPHIGVWISSILTGTLVDYTIRKHGQVVWNRRFTSLIGVVFPLACTLGMGHAKCNVTAVVILYCCSIVLKGPYYCSLKVNHLDLTYNFAGTVMALVNGLGCLTGIIGPLIIMDFAPNNTLKEWLTVFWVVSSLNLFLHLIYVFHCSGERAVWDLPPKE